MPPGAVVRRRALPMGRATDLWTLRGRRGVKSPCIRPGQTGLIAEAGRVDWSQTGAGLSVGVARGERRSGAVARPSPTGGRGSAGWVARRAVVAARAIARAVAAGVAQLQDVGAVEGLRGPRRVRVLGGQPQHAAPGPAQPVDVGLGGAAGVGLPESVGDDDQQPRGAGPGQAQRAVEGIEGLVGVPRRCRWRGTRSPGRGCPGVHDRPHMLAEDHRGGGGVDQGVAGGVGQDPRGRGDRAGELDHRPGHVAGDAQPQRRGRHGACGWCG